MLNKFSRSIRKYPYFYSTLFLGLFGLLFRFLNKSGLSDICFITSALVAAAVGFSRTLYILRHGYFGIPGAFPKGS
jgi:hypothetical protein